MGSDVHGFLARFERFGSAPSVERYVDLFQPDATLFDSGMEHPLGMAEIPAHMETILAGVPDFRFEIRDWRERQGTVFVRADNRATVAGRALRWESVYCITLREDRVQEGRRYYDRRPLVSLLNPDLPELPGYVPVRSEDLADPVAVGSAEEFVERYAALWQSPEPERFADFYAADGTILNPGMDRPIGRAEIPGYYGFLLSFASGLRMQLGSWAGDERLVFVEWLGTGTVGERPLELRVVDGFELEGGLVRAGFAHFDTVPLIGLLSG